MEEIKIEDAGTLSPPRGHQKLAERHGTVASQSLSSEHGLLVLGFETSSF